MMLTEMLLRLGLSLLVGGLVGFERERRDRPAGLRTHILVCVGSALITLVSQEMGSGIGDPTRIAAQIVSGIGFLGAGTIFRYGATIRGLTTAAGLWVVAGIGMGIAAGGLVLIAAVVTGATVFALNNWLRALEDRFSRDYREVALTLPAESVAAVLEGLGEKGVEVEGVRARSRSEDPGVTLRLRLLLPGSETRARLTGWLSTQAGVTGVQWEQGAGVLDSSSSQE